MNRQNCDTAGNPITTTMTPRDASEGRGAGREAKQDKCSHCDYQYLDESAPNWCGGDWCKYDSVDVPRVLIEQKEQPSEAEAFLAEIEMRRDALMAGKPLCDECFCGSICCGPLLDAINQRLLCACVRVAETADIWREHLQSERKQP
jgi:hypothetical protein